MEKLRKLISENKELHLKVRSFRLKFAGNTIDEMINQAFEVNGIKVVAAKINIANSDELRQIGDQLKNKLKSGIGILITETNGKVSLLTIVTKDLTARYHAGKIAGKVAEIVGGRGGGRADMAMAGGKDATKIAAAIKQIPEIIKNL
jgi:alanyl-tRNA synthetase